MTDTASTPEPAADVSAEEMTTIGKFFDLLRKLVDKAQWFTEDEHREAHATLNAMDPATKDLPPGPVAEPIPAPDPPTPAEAAAASAAQDDTGGQPLHAAASDTTEASPPEAEPVDPTPAADTAPSPSPATDAPEASSTSVADSSAPADPTPNADDTGGQTQAAAASDAPAPVADVPPVA